MAGFLGFRMILTRQHILIMLLFALALTFYVLKQLKLDVFFISSYGNDLLFIPLLMIVSEKLMRWIYSKEFNISGLHISVAIIYTSFVFEWILPHNGYNYTSDIMDIICYATGGIIYFWKFRGEVLSKSHSSAH
jgi:hypothetical protein